MSEQPFRKYNNGFRHTSNMFRGWKNRFKSLINYYKTINTCKSWTYDIWLKLSHSPKLALVNEIVCTVLDVTSGEDRVIKQRSNKTKTNHKNNQNSNS